MAREPRGASAAAEDQIEGEALVEPRREAVRPRAEADRPGDDGVLEDEDVLDDAEPIADPAIEDDPRVPALFRSSRAFGILLVVLGSVGVLASAMLTIEYLHKLQEPSDALLCDINPFITCGPAMMSTAGHIVFGIPNIIIGLICFTIVVTTGMALLAGARMRSWYWVGLQLGVTFGGCLITYLQWFSVFELARLCLWCMIIWSTTIPLAVAVTAWNLARGHLGAAAQRFGRQWAYYWWVVAIIWALCVVGVIVAGMWQTIQLSFR